MEGVDGVMESDLEVMAPTGRKHALSTNRRILQACGSPESLKQAQAASSVHGP